MRVVCPAILLVSVFALHTHASDSVKKQYLKDIFKSAASLTSNALADIDHEEKERVLLKIREKLVNASASMGLNAEKYVDLVMDGVETIAYSNDIDAASNYRRDASHQALGEEESTKNELIRSIAQKIQTLTKHTFKKNETTEEKKKIMDNIKKRIIESAKKQNVKISSEKDNIKPYSELVVEGVEMVLHQKIDNGTNRRMNVDFGGDSDNKIKVNKETDTSDDFFESNTLHPLSLTKRPQDLCEVFMKRTCSQILGLNKFTCRHNKKVILLEQLCDGETDCPDKSDEKLCTKNAIKKLHTASHIIAGVEAFIPRHCIKATLGDKLWTKQNDIFKDVLEKQATILNQFEKRINKFNEEDRRNAIYQASMVVKTVGLSLGSAFCADDRLLYQEDVFSRRSGDILEEDKDVYLKSRTWAPPECTCNERFCVKKDCDPACERICWQRYILGRWTCTAVTGDDSVSLDLLCDGKIDCYNESDESGCTAGSSADKFEARDTYKLILKVLSTKILTAEFQPVFIKFNSFQESIKALLKHSTEARVDPLTVKDLREKCFSELVGIFDAIIAKAEIIEKVNDARVLLDSVKNQLISALKRSNTGNERIVGSGECLCRETRCAMTVCTPSCVRTCAVKPIFTEYSCGGGANTTIPIESICNNKTDCPDGDDEEHCLKDICRNHHLFVLRHKIENLKNVQKGSILGEIIKDWQNKTVTKLVETEKTGRSTRRVLLKMVAQSLYDLTMAYASLGEFRRTSAKQSVDEFLVIVRLLQNTLKSCSK